MEIEPEYQILIRYYLENNSNSELITIIPETAMLFETTTNKHKIDITDIYLFLKFDAVKNKIGFSKDNCLVFPSHKTHSLMLH